MHVPNRIDQLAVRHALEHVSLRTRLQCPMNILVALIRRQHNEGGILKFFPDRAAGLDAAHYGHPQIHQGDIRLELAEHLDRLPAIRRLADYHPGTITGTVQDQATAGVPNATVVAQNADTGAQFKTVTTGTGTYTTP